MNFSIYDQSRFLTVKATYMYYFKDFNQKKIAKKLNISVSTVSRLLKRSREEGIIEFVIRDPYMRCIELGEKLKDKFKLKDAIVAPGLHLNSTSLEQLKKSVALEGARYIERIITEDDILGITWGSTVANLIHYLNPCKKTNASFITLHGSIANCADEFDVRPLVTRMAMAFGGKHYIIYTEGLVSNERIANSLKTEKNIKKVFDMFDKATIALFGMGSFYPTITSILAQSNYLTTDEVNELKLKNVAGDISLHFFDINGHECNTGLKDRTIAIDFQQFKNINTKIAVVSGNYKTHTVLAALKGRLIDILITDCFLARSILNKADKYF